MARQDFGSFTHHQSGEWIIKPVAVHAIDQFSMAHAHAPARAFRKIRDARHAFRAAGENNMRTAQRDLFRRQDDRA